MATSIWADSSAISFPRRSAATTSGCGIWPSLLAEIVRAIFGGRWEARYEAIASDARIS